MKKNNYLLKFSNNHIISLVSVAFSLFLLVLISAPLSAQLIVYEPFNYAIDLVQPDPDGGVNGGNGLPYTNVGGDPPGTSIGLRTHYGNDHKVVAGLSYSNVGGTLVTAGNALQRFSGTGNSANDAKIYRNMITDPFAAYRSEASTDWFGWNSASGTKELYFSVLLNASSINTGVDNGLLMYVGFDNSNLTWRLVQSGTDWKFRHHDTSYKTLGAATANTTVFVVGRFTFTSATSTTIDLWFNPTLGSALGTPTATKTTTTTTSGGQFRSILTYNGANIFTYDEFRLGVTAADVMPYTPNPSTGLENSKSDIKVVNINKNTCEVRIPDVAGVSSVEMYNIAGVCIQKNTKVTTSNLFTMPQSGVYFITVNKQGKKEVFKVISH